MNKTFRKPDLNGARFRPKRLNLLEKSLFDRFKEKFPEHKELTLTEFKDIVKTYNGELYQGVIDFRDGVELPEGLGFIFMGSCPPAKKQNVDIAKSAKYGVLTNHKNWESDNKLLKIFYTNETSKYPFMNKQVWAFKGVKDFRKAASNAFIKDWTKYIVVDNKRKISRLYKAELKRTHVLAKGAVIPKGYDEFKM